MGSSKRKKELSLSELRKAVVGAGGDGNKELDLRQVKFYIVIRL